MSAIDVSLVVTVYNKERYLPATLSSLLMQRQTSQLAVEYVFVDDVSSDSSVACIEKLTRGLPDVVIVRNTENAGPSVRLNQGARVARGKYLQFLDSDDILAANATEVMHGLLLRHEADIIHGQWERTQLEGELLLGRFIQENPGHEISDAPLREVLRGRYLRMAQMCSRQAYMQAGGADERIFIQDQSLPLRLAACARRFIGLNAPVIYIPAVEGQLSGNISQLNHDRFLANYYLLQDYPDLAPELRALLFNRCVSACWKQARRAGLISLAGVRFRRYLAGRLGLMKETAAAMADMKAYMDHLSGVRRMAQESKACVD